MRNIIKMSLIFVYLSLLICIYSDDSHIFQRLTVDNGLSNANIYDIVQDFRGFLWIGTRGGLHRYDGYEFKIYKHDMEDENSLRDNYITCLLEDSNKTLWIGTEQGGLSRFDLLTEKFTNFAAKDDDNTTVNDNQIWGLLEAPDGTIWISTFSGGINVFDPKTQTFTYLRYDSDDDYSISDDNVWPMVIDKDNNIWAGTDQFGLNKYDFKEKKFYRYEHDPYDSSSISSDSVWALCVDSDGVLWVGTSDNGLNMYDSENDRFIRYLNVSGDPLSLSNNRIRCVFEDKEKRLWVGTNNGLSLFDRKSGTFTNSYSDPLDKTTLSHSMIKKVFQDSSGVLWFGTREGLSKLVSRKFTPYYINYKGVDLGILNSIKTIVKLENGDVFIATNVGLYRTSETNNNIYHQILPTRINGILKDMNDVLWIVTESELLRYDVARGKIEKRDEKGDLTRHSTSEIVMYTDHLNRLWFGTGSNGIALYDEKNDSIKWYSADEGAIDSLSNNDIGSMLVDSSGNFWIGTEGGGLNRFVESEGKFIKYPELKDKFVYSMREDSSKNIWFGTFNVGLVMYEVSTGKFHYITESNGLPNNLVRGVEIDKNDNVWISTERGFAKYSIKDKKMTNFDADDGIPSVIFRKSCSFSANDGEMLFGTSFGYISFYPSEILDDNFVAPISVSRFYMVGKEYNVANYIYSNREIKIPSNINYFSFEVSSLSLRFPGKNRYAFKLDGIDKEWIYLGNNRYIPFSNMHPGSYRLMVKGTNSDGLWNEKGMTIRFRVVPPFYRSIFAYILYILLIVTAISILVKARIDVNRIKIEKLLEQEKLNQQIEKEKMLSLSRLVAGIAHEINTPVGICITASTHLNQELEKTLIDFNEGVLKKSTLEKFLDLTKDSTSLLYSNLSKADDLVRNFKKLSIDQSTENVRVFNVRDYLEAILFALSPQINRTTHKTVINCPTDIMMNSFPSSISQIFNNLVINSLTHGFAGKENGTIQIDVSKIDGVVIFEYKDDGVGVPHENINMIFDPFFTTNRAGGGSGLGLHIVYNLIVQQLKGTIKCSSEVGAGTVFTIEIPEDVSIYHKST